MQYTSVLMVPSSKDGVLLKELAKVEPRLAKSTKYQVKLVEKSGKPLSGLFSTSISSGKCYRLDCAPCNNPKVKGPSMCKVKNVVYESVCTTCDIEHMKDPSSVHRGVYVGQTYRTLYERALEHQAALRRLDMSSFMLNTGH